jgi:hypothetical protein
VAVIRRVEEDGINVRCTGAHFLWRLLCDGLRRQALMPLLWASKCATYFANIGHAEAGWLAIVTIMGLTGFVAAFLALCLVNFVIGLFCTFALPVGWLSLFAGLVVDVILVRRILEAPHYDSFYWLNS